MSQNIGNAIAYAGGTTHVPLPRADAVAERRRHNTSRPRPTGLNWDAIRPADAPPTPEAPATDRCRGCGNDTPVAELRSHLCPVCATAAEERFHAPDTTTLGRALGELAAQEPTVAAASAKLDAAVHRITHPEDHTTPPAPGTGDPVADHCAHLIASTAHATNPAVRILRSAALSALAALDLIANPDDTPLTPPATAPAPEQATPRAGSTVPRKPRRRTRFGPIDEAEVVRRYQNGESAPTIAKDLATTPQRIRRVLDDHHIPRRDDRATRSGGRRKTDDPGFVDQVRALYVDQQLSQAEVADRLGVSAKVIWRVIDRTPDITPRPSAADLSSQGVGRPQKIPPADHQAVADRYRAGESAPAIAADYHCSSAAIYALLTKLGVPRRPRGKS